jgi:protein-L-isoaspartate(D-aspartate) O-methyltransferase
VTEDHDPDEQRRTRMARFILGLRSQGIRDRNVLSAIERVPRELFLGEDIVDFAYDDRALPIDCGQTISQPFVVAYMTAELGLDDRMKVLEIGTGSGYQTAVLAHLSRRVYSIERFRTLAKLAEERLAKLGLSNVTIMFGDGMEGWPPQAPFDRILVTAAAEDVPSKLVDQLKEGGRMVLPVGPVGGVQKLVRIERTAEGVTETPLVEVRFVPLVAGKAKFL